MISYQDELVSSTCSIGNLGVGGVQQQNLQFNIVYVNSQNIENLLVGETEVDDSRLEIITQELDIDCTGPFQRLFYENGSSFCVDHKNGQIQNSEKIHESNQNCIGHPMHIDVLIQGETVSCIKKIDDAWCSSNNYAYDDIDSDGNSETICQENDGQLKIKSDTINSVISTALKLPENYKILTGDFNGDGQKDYIRISVVEGLGKLHLQQNSIEQMFDEQNCPNFDSQIDHSDRCNEFAENGDCQSNAMVMHKYCPKTCGLCIGTLFCKNTLQEFEFLVNPLQKITNYNCLYVKNEGKCSETSNCELICDQCDPVYATPRPWFKSSFDETIEFDNFCVESVSTGSKNLTISNHRIVMTGDYNGDGVTDIGCFDWVRGNFEYFDMKSRNVVKEFYDFCKSRFVPDKNYAQLYDQATGKLHFEIRDGHTFLCISRKSKKVYAIKNESHKVLTTTQPITSTTQIESTNLSTQEITTNTTSEISNDGDQSEVVETSEKPSLIKQITDLFSPTSATIVQTSTLGYLLVFLLIF